MHAKKPPEQAGRLVQMALNFYLQIILGEALVNLVLMHLLEPALMWQLLLKFEP